MRLRRTERGAAAVELALVLPVLLLVVFGIVDFGRAYNTQITLATAAREGVRVWALGGTTDDVQKRATQAAVGMSVTATPVIFDSATGQYVPTTTPCTFGDPATVQVTTDFSYITPYIKNLAPDLTTLDSEGVMRCGG